MGGLRVPNFAWLDAWGCWDEGSIQALGQPGSRRAPELLGEKGLGWASALQGGRAGEQGLVGTLCCPLTSLPTGSHRGF